jgi:hypothetical protein
MKLAHAFLLMTTTLASGSAVLAAGQGVGLTLGAANVSMPDQNAPNGAITLVDGDEEGGWIWQWGEDDDDEDEDDDCEDDDDDDNCATGAAGNAAKAGTVAPPQNGLFTNGTAPVVKSN